MNKITESSLNQIFYDARTYNGWLNKPVEESILQEIYELTKLCPTSANCSPVRIVFIKTLEAKERLKPFIDAGNLEKTMAAPVTAIFGYDLEFYEHLPYLFPYKDLKGYFAANKAFTELTAFRNSSLQGAYFIIAARSLGLDCGPMSGFNNEGVDKEFFPDGKIKSNFLCNLGYGDPASLYGPRAPRLSYDDVCRIL